MILPHLLGQCEFWLTGCCITTQGTLRLVHRLPLEATISIADESKLHQKGVPSQDLTRKDNQGSKDSTLNCTNKKSQPLIELHESDDSGDSSSSDSSDQDNSLNSSSSDDDSSEDSSSVHHSLSDTLINT